MTYFNDHLREGSLRLPEGDPLEEEDLEAMSCDLREAQENGVPLFSDASERRAFFGALAGRLCEKSRTEPKDLRRHRVLEHAVVCGIVFPLGLGAALEHKRVLVVEHSEQPGRFNLPGQSRPNVSRFNPAGLEEEITVELKGAQGQWWTPPEATNTREGAPQSSYALPDGAVRARANTKFRAEPPFNPTPPHWIEPSSKGPRTVYYAAFWRVSVHVPEDPRAAGAWLWWDDPWEAKPTPVKGAGPRRRRWVRPDVFAAKNSEERLSPGAIPSAITFGPQQHGYLGTLKEVLRHWPTDEIRKPALPCAPEELPIIGTLRAGGSLHLKLEKARTNVDSQPDAAGALPAPTTVNTPALEPAWASDPCRFGCKSRRVLAAASGIGVATVAFALWLSHRFWPAGSIPRIGHEGTPPHYSSVRLASGAVFLPWCTQALRGWQQAGNDKQVVGRPPSGLSSFGTLLNWPPGEELEWFLDQVEEGWPGFGPFLASLDPRISIMSQIRTIAWLTFGYRPKATYEDIRAHLAQHLPLANREPLNELFHQRVLHQGKVTGNQKDQKNIYAACFDKKIPDGGIPAKAEDWFPERLWEPTAPS